MDDKEDGKKQKKKGKIGFRNRFFGSKLEGVPREKMNGEGRFVEGGNDRLPTIPSKEFKLPQEVHDKFAGKSREVRIIGILVLSIIIVIIFFIIIKTVIMNHLSMEG